MSISTAPITPDTSKGTSTDTFMSLDQYPDLNVSFSSWEIAEIRQSWASMRDDQLEVSQEKANVGTASAFFCQQFYENLLGEYPELSVLFPSIKSQASSMAGILALVISQLDNLPRVREVLISLGKRHSRIIGVEVTHYELVGNALLRTLSDRIQDEFTPELENAWIKFFTYITNLMLQAGEDPPLPAQTLYPVLTPVSSNNSSISPAARRALKPRVSDSVDTQKPLPATTNISVPTSANAANVTQNTASGNSNIISSNYANTVTSGPQTYTSNSGYSPSTSHFKTANTPGAKQKKRRGGKGQECSIM